MPEGVEVTGLDYIYESIPMDAKLNINLFLHNPKYVPDHWHDSLELLFVLKGNVSVFIQRKKYSLGEEDLLLINSNEIHSIESEADNLLLALQIPISFIRDHFEDIDQVTFHCKSFLYEPDEQEKFNEIRALLAEMMWVYSKESYGYEMKMKSLLFELVYLLLRKFKEGEREDGGRLSPKHMERMLRIAHYIQENYTKPLNLNDLAEQEHLSVPYLSSFFQKHMGQSFIRYVNRIRLNHAVNDIAFTDYSITKIALDHGFPNLKSFHKVFKDVYNTTPNQYRKNLREQTETEPKLSGNKVTYLEFDRENGYGALFKYLPDQSKGLGRKSTDVGVVTKEIRVQFDGKGKPLKPYWRTLCTIGKAKEGLYRTVQEQLRSIQSVIKFEYIRFHGIFDDEMMVYREDRDGQPVFNFFYVDQLFDFLQDIGLKPYIEFGFMPSDLASGDQCIFYKKSNISKPKDLARWVELVRQFMAHCRHRYGLEEMRTWYYTCWNEPDLPLFWEDSFEDYCDLYLHTYRVVKDMSADFRFGGPEMISDTIYKEGWLQRFWSFCRSRECLPDFASFHSYPAGFHDDEKGEFIWLPNSRASDYLSDTVAQLKKNLQQEQLRIPEIHVTEWNATGSHRDLTNDTCFKAAYIAKNIVENLDEVSSLAYWTITDHLEELPLPEHTFHGGLGLITNNGIKKPGYYAYELLSQLGDRLLDRGSGYCVTQAGDRFQLLAYHYCHYDKLYEVRESLGIDTYNRYHVFQDLNEYEMNFVCQGIPAGRYELRQIAISREHGSAYDTWLDMGAPASLTPDMADYLNRKAAPHQQYKVIDIEGAATFSCKLTPHEVRLFELRPLRQP
ncbi:GH39 family glycosyl hydrolase [Paenibacillus apiarius]|uniref:Helix-turn-helix domain-containing protein n=1 Tax=Paenibacillus apiarius TaxID=46240 RepID=A0ABT4DTQ6_9BACL|nr:helix-turn-helix domain-containing protein [Paenibacillus apiarius]MCY9513976.1 helix-turn-helix domain-containing protein [Paenibacillus apiarius]MCY9519493.1 helix-turn-helix domain-containing protein [Paenibacillus apiarius]MCY9552420.1 helix-turn-helix domain-containing protein [Paenibacillus apiarius]MCY9556249.1 helix-turn-helix domain-containing protein [Paenibacillus apiarius]MCY9681783.1 helix-turn-helix domain-containing protein [Paenibacillus apiarius]